LTHDADADFFPDSGRVPLLKLESQEKGTAVDRVVEGGPIDAEVIDKSAFLARMPLVNFILDQLETRRPFRSDMRVIDASCGSGVFLVQCYRKLIEQQARENANNAPKPVELRDLLIDHIFGIDTDTDACQIAEPRCTKHR
jgi:hypothetical protein